MTKKIRNKGKGIIPVTTLSRMTKFCDGCISNIRCKTFYSKLSL